MRNTRDENGKLKKEVPLIYKDGKFWELSEDLQHTLHNGFTIVIPNGFI